MLFALAFIWNFLIGGITGIFLSDVPADVQLHGGMFVTAHFHYTIVGGALMGFFAAVYFWFPKMTGRMMDEKLGWISFWGIQIGFNVAFLAMFYRWPAGHAAPRRRLSTRSSRARNFITSIFAFLLGASVIALLLQRDLLVDRRPEGGSQSVGREALEWRCPRQCRWRTSRRSRSSRLARTTTGEPSAPRLCRFPVWRLALR